MVENGLDATMLGGDFNLVRFREEKSSGNVTARWMDLFNDFIADNELRELHRSGGLFTWSNNQDLPVRVVLDRVLVSAEHERAYPLITVQTLMRIGSDHSALLVDSGVR